MEKRNLSKNDVKTLLQHPQPHWLHQSDGQTKSMMASTWGKTFSFYKPQYSYQYMSTLRVYGYA